MNDWISLIWQGHVWGHIEDTFKPSNFFLFRHFYSFEHILTEEYLIFIQTINITKNQMILVMSCFVVLKRRNWFELRIYSGSDWAQCAAGHAPCPWSTLSAHSIWWCLNWGVSRIIELGRMCRFGRLHGFTITDKLAWWVLLCSPTRHWTDTWAF